MRYPKDEDVDGVWFVRIDSLLLVEIGGLSCEE